MPFEIISTLIIDSAEFLVAYNFVCKIMGWG